MYFAILFAKIEFFEYFFERIVFPLGKQGAFLIDLMR